MALLLAMLTIPAFSEILPRRAFLGVHLLNVCDSVAILHKLDKTTGIRVVQVVDHSTAMAIGLQPHDIILEANGKPVTGVGEFVTGISRRQEGDSIIVTISRHGQPIIKRGVMTGFPKETSPHASVIYDQVPFEDGYARTIIHRPHATGKHPAFFFIQGGNCMSMDNLGDHLAHKKLLEGISERGYVVIKTEKAGVGDSRSSRNCSDVSFFDEVALFSASYNALANHDFIDLDNVFIFGHSMGGVQAPLLQKDFAPRGIIVFGTVARPWFEYHIEVTRKQRLMLGQDYLINEDNHEQSIRFFYRFMIEKESPEQLLQDPDMAEYMRRHFGYSEGGYMHGRHYTFWQQLQDTKPFRAWSQVDAYVLALHGDGEFVALNPYEPQLIADIVNHYNPGKASFKTVPNVDHGFIYVNDLEHAISIRNNLRYQETNFHYGMVNLLVNWMNEHRAP